MSHWAFVLMGLHLGMHIPVMFARLHLTDKLKAVISAALCVVAGIGLFLFIRNGMPDYLFFRVPFAFLDYEKAGILVFIENGLMLLFWGFIGTEAAVLCRNSQMKTEDKKNPLLPVVFIMGAIIIGLVINMISGSTSGQSFDEDGWNREDSNLIIQECEGQPDSERSWAVFLRPTAHMSNERKSQCVIRCIFNGFLTHFFIQFNNNVVTYWCGSE